MAGKLADGNPDPDSRLKNDSNHQIDLCPLYGRTPAQTDRLRLKSTDPSRFGRLKSQFLDRDGSPVDADTPKAEEYAPYLQVEPFAEKNPDGAAEPWTFHYNPDFVDDNGKLVLDRPLLLKKFAEDPERLRRLFAFGGDRTNASPQVAAVNTLFLREHNRLAGEIVKEVGNSPDNWDDDRVFETARNANIVMFIKIVVEEYINHISSGFRFRADPAVAWDAAWNRPNWITTEFSLLYRWHSLIPDKIWWGNEDNSFAPMESALNNKPLIENGLVKAFIDLSKQPAGYIGPRNTAEGLLDLEILAIQQGRQARLASYCKYRKYVGLKVPRDFSDFPGDDKTIEILKGLYGRVDQVEFYTGLFAEKLDSDAAVPDLLLYLVAIDAFSQALTNPLLSRNVWNYQCDRACEKVCDRNCPNKARVFSKAGWEAIYDTKNLQSLLDRNKKKDERVPESIGMTLEGWRGTTLC